MNKLLICFLLSFAVFFSACDNSIVSSLIAGNYSDNGDGIYNGPYITGDMTGMNDMEIEIVKELNRLRADPQGWLIRHKANVGEIWDNAYNPSNPNTMPFTLRGRPPSPQLSVISGLSKAAQKHAEDTDMDIHYDAIGDYIRFTAPLACLTDSFMDGVTGNPMTGEEIVLQGKSRLAGLGYPNATDAEAVIYEFIIFLESVAGYYGNIQWSHLRREMLQPIYHYVGVGYRNNRIVFYLGFDVWNIDDGN